MPERRQVPPVAWVLSGAAGVAVTILAVILLTRKGQHAFFTAGDSKFFLLTTRDLFGTGHGYAAIGAAAQVPYRYGRMPSEAQVEPRLLRGTRRHVHDMFEQAVAHHVDLGRAAFFGRRAVDPQFALDVVGRHPGLQRDGAVDRGRAEQVVPAAVAGLLAGDRRPGR